MNKTACQHMQMIIKYKVDRVPANIVFSYQSAGQMTDLSNPSSANRSQEFVGASRQTGENWQGLAFRPVYNLNATHLEPARLWNVRTVYLTDMNWTRPAVRSALVAIFASEASVAPKRKNVV